MNKLPPELVDSIGSHFEYSDWCALRLTCKTLHRLSCSHFARRYFRRVSVILTREAIAELEALTLHETFRYVVEELSIIPQVFGDYEVDLDAFKAILYLCTPGSRDWTTEEVQAQYIIYKAAQTDHLAFAESASSAESLTRCLSRLTNVSTIGLRACPAQQPSKKETHFVCIGTRALQKQLPFDPCVRLLMPSARRLADRPLTAQCIVREMWKDIRHPVWTKGLTSLFEALCTVSPPLAVQRLYTCLAEDDLVVPPDCFTLSKPLYQSLQLVLHELRDLDICLGPSKPNDTAESLPCLLIRAAPKLHILRLTLWDQFHDLSSDHFTDLAHKIRFGCLSELHLHWVELTQPSFQLFLRTAAPTLRVLTLVAVSLNDPVPVPMGRSPEFQAAMYTVWRRFLNTLRDTVPGIHFFRMRRLAYRQRSFKTRDPSRMPLISKGFRSISEHPNSTFYKISPIMSFSEWINQLELDSRYHSLGAHLPRHRGMLIACATSWLLNYR
ncbi:hypothetical protein AbraIFM66951_000558 [Aspergillus brasiliensis]|uniref:F-box domain-containing protein n=1 Tax=Aspergillus brasiliensis TaxID=319629 RepID=A0A9W5YX74_9EURO|nr:hypothetical protein AbraCBS73388_000672 [Aspergillus brasiliensis]GKZ48490.1 hypothetical protein AbraIFM66951_000558 [Aspergillus brasiliensis]